MAKDYVDLEIDVDRMEHGKEVQERLVKGRSGGLPWLVILDAQGRELATSVGPNGNIGCPVTEEEAAWFVEMLRRSRLRLTDEDLARIRREHDAFAEPIRKRMRRR